MRPDLIVLAVFLGLTGILWATRPTPYESYNNAMDRCLSIVDVKQKETCMVAINSGYTRMLDGQNNNKNKDNK